MEQHQLMSMRTVSGYCGNDGQVLCLKSQNLLECHSDSYTFYSYGLSHRVPFKAPLGGDIFSGFPCF